MKKITITLIALLLAVSVFGEGIRDGGKIPIKALLLPKFEVGEMTGDFPGEAQFYHNRYTNGGEVYEITGGFEKNKLYVKDGVALYVTGMGKVNAALSVNAVLNDSRFDFSKAYIISTGCAGGIRELTTMGDVMIASGAADFDLGHHLDSLEIPANTPAAEKWIHVDSYSSSAYVKLNNDLVQRAAELVSGVTLKTTDKTRAVLNSTFKGAEWAIRDPKIIIGGSVVTGDNYWKGERDEAVAARIAKTYGLDQYLMTEMEDVAIGTALKRLGMLDRYIIIRGSVNMDVFIGGATPMSWKEEEESKGEFIADNVERADIFFTAMQNNFLVGAPIVDAILAGTF
jgi:purine nucleoside permease